MERLTQRDLRRLLAALRELYASADLDTLPGRILSVLPKVVPVDLMGYNEIDSNRRRAIGRMEPFEGDVDAALRIFGRHVHEHPIVRYRLTGERASARKISDFLTQRQFHQLGLYREFYRPLGIEYQMTISLPAPPPLVIGFTLNRAHPDFSERERLLLELLRPHVVRAYENAEAVTRMNLARAEDRAVACSVVAVDRHGRVRTEPGRHRIEEYFGKFGRSGRLPDRLDRWVMNQRACLAENGGAPAPRTALEIERAGKRLVVRLLSEPSGDQLLLLEERTAVAAPSLESLGLTRREAEVLRWVAEGKTNQEVATILNLSSLTVRTHLAHIFRKLGVETRTAAAVVALQALSSFAW
jgi:DNA-binding CsgD family transcriptional regulator